MIKVNLLRNMGLGAKGGFVEVADPVAPGVVKTGVLKLFVILIFPLLLYAYERMLLNESEERLRVVKSKVEKVLAERAKYGDAAPIIEQYNKQKTRVDKELEGVRTIAKARLREVKALDAIQSLMPDKTWTKKISIDGNIVRLEGYAKESEGISILIRALEDNVFFSKVEPKYTAQETLPSGPVKKFELEFRIGKQE